MLSKQSCYRPSFRRSVLESRVLEEQFGCLAVDLLPDSKRTTDHFCCQGCTFENPPKKGNYVPLLIGDLASLVDLGYRAPVAVTRFCCFKPSILFRSSPGRRCLSIHRDQRQPECRFVEPGLGYGNASHRLLVPRYLAVWPWCRPQWIAISSAATSPGMGAW